MLFDVHMITGYVPLQYWLAVFRNPYSVILQIKDRMARSPIVLHSPRGTMTLAHLPGLPELRKRQVFRDVFEDDLDRRADGYFPWFGINHVADKPHALLHLNEDHRIWS